MTPEQIKDQADAIARDAGCEWTFDADGCSLVFYRQGPCSRAQYVMVGGLPLIEDHHVSIVGQYVDTMLSTIVDGRGGVLRIPETTIELCVECGAPFTDDHRCLAIARAEALGKGLDR